MESNFLSVRAQHILSELSINSEEELIKFFKSDQSFKQMRNSGKITEQELNEYCNQIISDKPLFYINNADTAKIKKELLDLLQVTSDEYGTSFKPYHSEYEVYEEEKNQKKFPNDYNLSKRSNNVIKDNGLNSIQLAHSYYQEHGGFKKLKFCGQKSNDELIDVIKKYKKEQKLSNKLQISKSVTIESFDTNTFSDENFTLSKRLIINLLKINLTGVVKETFIDFLENKHHTYATLFNLFFNKSEIIKDIILNQDLYEKGLNTLLDFNKYIKQIKENRFDTNKVKIEAFHSVVQNVFKDYPYKMFNDLFFSNITDEVISNNTSVFSFFNFMMKNKYVIEDDKTNYIYLKRTDYIQHQKKISLRELGIELSLTRERVRQIFEQDKNELLIKKAMSCIVKLLDYNNAITSLKNETYFYVNEEFIDEINRRENCNFSILFYEEILSNYLKDQFVIVKIDEKKLFVSNKIENSFDIKRFFAEICKERKNDIVKNYTLNMHNLVAKYKKCKNTIYLEDKLEENSILKSLCIEIMSKYFEPIFYDNGNFNFIKRRMQKHEYCYIILEKMGLPMHLDQMYEECKKIFPNSELQKESIRSSIIGNDTFICFSRKSTYGLKKWEIIDDDIKGGTIRDRVEEVLVESDKPLHVKEILEYVNKYNDTNEMNIATSIKLDQSGRFLSYPMGFIALKDKQYNLKLSHKRVAPQIVRYMKEYIKHDMDDISYNKLIQHFCLKYNINTDMLRLIVNLEINFGNFCIKDNIITCSKNCIIENSKKDESISIPKTIYSKKRSEGNGNICKLIQQLSKLKIADQGAVVDASSTQFDEFKNYMHIDRKVEKVLKSYIEQASASNKSELILVCGNVGDGKSHLLASLKNKYPDLFNNFYVHNDATESLDIHKNYIETLNDILFPFRNENLGKGKDKIVLAINLGTLTNYLESEGDKFSELARYVRNKNILNNVIGKNNFENKSNFNYINLTDYKIFSLSENGPKSEILRSVFNKITKKDEDNPFYSSYKSECINCANNCPIKANFELLMLDNIQNKLEYYLIRIMIEFKQIISIRSLLNFMNDIIVPSDCNLLSKEMLLRKFKGKKYDYTSKLIPNYLFEHNELSSIFNYINKLDPALLRSEKMDEIIVKLYITDNKRSIFNDNIIMNNSSLSAENFNLEQPQSEKLIRSFIRFNFFLPVNHSCIPEDSTYISYMKYVYYWNTRQIKELKKIYTDVKEAIYLWNGKTNQSNHMNLMIGQSQLEYKISQTLKLEFPIIKNKLVTMGDIDEFIPELELSYKPENANKYYSISIDFSLYKLLHNIINGYRPNKLDKSSFINLVEYINVLSEYGEKNNVVYIKENIPGINKSYKLYIDEFDGSYQFEEV